MNVIHREPRNWHLSQFCDLPAPPCCLVAGACFEFRAPSCPPPFAETLTGEAPSTIDPVTSADPTAGLRRSRRKVASQRDRNGEGASPVAVSGHGGGQEGRWSMAAAIAGGQLGNFCTSKPVQTAFPRSRNRYRHRYRFGSRRVLGFFQPIPIPTPTPIRLRGYLCRGSLEAIPPPDLPRSRRRSRGRNLGPVDNGPIGR